MPLPAALLERLAKRGIVPPSDEDEQQQHALREQPPIRPHNKEGEEEVIAEDYDDEDSESDRQNSDRDDAEVNDQSSRVNCSILRNQSSLARSRSPVPGCPNKVNLHHSCTDYCLNTYGKGKECPSPRTESKYQSLLKRFPLPPSWNDIWEPGTGRYYFWNTETDEVSWWPPLHPKARPSLSVYKLRKMAEDDDKLGSNSEESDEDEEEGSEDDSSSSSSEEEYRQPRPEHQSFKRPGERADDRGRGRKILKRNDLDPMDPSSYSEDCPRGKWSDGLVKSRDDGEKAADSTATGPLFQQRPLPSPGEVLRMNRKGSK